MTRSDVASTVLVELSISNDRFELGDFVAQQPDLDAELERVVPSQEYVIPYVWVRGTDDTLTAFQNALAESDTIRSVDLLDQIDGELPEQYQRLYRIEWVIDKLDVLGGVIEAEGTILEGYSTDGYWFLRLRFPDHEHVAAFYQYLTANEISDFHIETIEEVTDRGNPRPSHGLTSKQREAIVLAAQRGYFETPRDVTLAELATELDITEQAVSQRLRQATKKLIFSALNLPNQP